MLAIPSYPGVATPHSSHSIHPSLSHSSCVVSFSLFFPVFLPSLRLPLLPPFFHPSPALLNTPLLPLYHPRSEDADRSHDRSNDRSNDRSYDRSHEGDGDEWKAGGGGGEEESEEQRGELSDEFHVGSFDTAKDGGGYAAAGMAALSSTPPTDSAMSSSPPSEEWIGSAWYETLMSRMRNPTQGVKTKTHRQYHACFTGTDAVDWLLENAPNQASDRAEAVAFGRMLRANRILRHVVNKRMTNANGMLAAGCDFEDSSYVYGGAGGREPCVCMCVCVRVCVCAGSFIVADVV